MNGVRFAESQGRNRMGEALGRLRRELSTLKNLEVCGGRKRTWGDGIVGGNIVSLKPYINYLNHQVQIKKKKKGILCWVQLQAVDACSLSSTELRVPELHQE